MNHARLSVRASIGLLLLSAACTASHSHEQTPERSSAQSADLVVGVTTLAGDEQRTGWYPNQPRLAPGIVGSSSFGRLFSTEVTGQIYAQPLVSNGTLFVATQTNDIYGLDPETGSVRWTRNLRGAWDPQDLTCGDLLPNIGIMSTPVIDGPTNTAYLLSKGYVSGDSGPAIWMAHAIDLDSGAERPNFPVQIQGQASNSTRIFDAAHASQRPGLLLMDGVVYAAFAAHCDRGPWAGWVAGIGVDGALKTLWTTMTDKNRSGAGIWQSGGGLVSDGPGQILFTTGNGGAPRGPIAGNNPPPQLGESIVRLSLQADGTLKATDFFAPYDAQALDGWDADLSSGGLAALPSSTFGTALYPKLMVQSGKQGYVYLLDRDNLGGIGNGASGADLVVNRIGPYGGVWSSPSVWPGDGGYVYIPTASGGNAAAGSQGVLRGYRYGLDGQGKPTLSLVGTSRESFGFSSSHPIVTSDGTTSGSALLWLVWSPNGTGVGAQLRAYDPVPAANGDFTLRFQAPIGTSSKFTPPGVGVGRVYVGTRDGHVLGFGATSPAPLSASAVEFDPVIVGQSAVLNAVFTASEAVTVDQIVPPKGDFSIGNPLPSLPATLEAGDTLSFSVTFAPTSSGLKASSAEAVALDARASVAISGRARSPDAELVISPRTVSFGATTVGGQIVSSLTISNAGAAPLTVESVTPPDAPFVLSGEPPTDAVLAADEFITLTVEFSPTVLGNYQGKIEVKTSAGEVSVPLSGRAGLAGKMTVSPTLLDFGVLAVGARREADFTVKNSGSTAITILKSKPPAVPAFVALTALEEGTPLNATTTLTETVAFTPTVAGDFEDGWTLTATDGLAEQTVTTKGRALMGACAPDGSDFVKNGTAVLEDDEIVLTRASDEYSAGSSFCPNPLPSSLLDVSFDFYEGDGSGGDGMALVLADGTKTTPQALGNAGSGLGYSGISGIAVAFDTYQSTGDPSFNFVGLARGPSADGNTLDWITTATATSALRGTQHHAHVFVSDGAVVVELDGAEVLREDVALPSTVLVGFSAGTGMATDRHAVSNISILDRALLPEPPSPDGGTGGEGGDTSQPGGGRDSDGGASPGPGSGGANAGGDPAVASGGEEAEGGTSTSPSGGRSSRAGRGGTESAGADGDASDSEDSGCSCRVTPTASRSSLLPLFFALGLLARRRRRGAR